MTHPGRIMVASPASADAALVRSLLAEAFDDIVVSTDPGQAASDYDQTLPDVLVLAMHPLEKAERHGLDLYRHSRRIQGHPHRTVVLCHGDEMRRAYELCRQDCFDDYVVFWPFNPDAPRLLMAVHHALRELDRHRDDTPSPVEFATLARQVQDLDTQLDRHEAQGRHYLDQADARLREAEQDIGAALDGFSRRLAESGPVRQGNPNFLQDLALIRGETLDDRLQTVGQAMVPLRQWAGSLKESLAPQLDSARALGGLAARLRQRLLLVDDDDMQHKLLAGMLANQNIELAGAHSAAEAWRRLNEQRPDLILMDLNLPDLDGLEVTRRIKATPQLAGIPIIMLTGQSGKDVVLDSLKAGARDFVVKPFDRAGLFAKLGSLLALS